MMERRVGDEEKPLTIEEIRGELNLRFERLSSKSMSNKEGEVLEEHAFFGGQFKGNVEIVGKSGTSHFSAKIAELTMAEVTVIQVVAFFVRIVASLVMTRGTVSS